MVCFILLESAQSSGPGVLQVPQAPCRQPPLLAATGWAGGSHLSYSSACFGAPFTRRFSEEDGAGLGTGPDFAGFLWSSEPAAGSNPYWTRSSFGQGTSSWQPETAQGPIGGFRAAQRGCTVQDGGEHPIREFPSRGGWNLPGAVPKHRRQWWSELRPQKHCDVGETLDSQRGSRFFHGDLDRSPALPAFHHGMPWTERCQLRGSPATVQGQREFFQSPSKITRYLDSRITSVQFCTVRPKQRLQAFSMPQHLNFDRENGDN